MAIAQETSAEEILRMTQPQQPGAAPAATPSSAMPEFSPDEVMSLAAEGQGPEEADPRDVALQAATAMYDWRNPRPSREEYFGNKELLADLKKQGVEADGPGVGAMIGDLFVSGVDAISSAVWKYDPANEGSITLRNAADFVTRGMYSNLQGKPSTFNPGAAMIETGRRAGATLAGANEFNLDFYKSLSRGLASSPKYRVEETGEFIYPGAMMPDAGMGDTTFDLAQMYKQQGKTLRPVGEEDLKDLEYEQFLQKLDSTQQLETLMEQGTASGAGTIARSVGVPEQVVSAGGDFVGRLNETIDIAARASGLAPAGYRTADLPWNQPQKPIQSQSMIGSMLVDPGAVGAGVLSPVRFGITAAAKGATARTLELTGKAATAVANLGDKGAKGARVAQRAKRLLGAGGVGAVANVMGQNMDSEAADEAVRFLNYGLGAYATLVGGGVVLRGYGNYAGRASYLLRESIGPGNAIDKGARAAVAVNPDVPLRYKDPLVRPSVYTAMESTPARLSKDMSLSPRARKLFGNLADWRAVQAVRGTSAAASGAVKGALANVPFSEPLRAAGEEDAANLMLGLGAVIGAPMGVAGRVSGTAGRRAMAADSDVGRMLAEVQGMGETVPRKRAPQADPDGEVMRALTEVELSGGDVSAMVNNLSPDRLNEFAAVQGYFRDTTDFVPLNAADFEANRKALNPNNSGPIFLHAPDGERPRVFVNVEDAGSIKAGDLGRAFLQSESLPDRQVAAMINSVETLYTPDQIAARERAIAKAEIDARYAKLGVKGGATDAEIDLRLAMLRSQSQTEFGDANIWGRQAIAAEDLSSGIVDWNRMRRGLPKGNNPITHLENVLGAQARGLMISGVRIDPETGRPLDTPDSLKRTNPAAADDPAVAQGLKNYTEGYNKMRRDPANETPTTEPVSPERAAAIELSMTDAPLRARQIMDLAGGPDGPSLTPDNLSFGWRQEGNRRILAGRSLPDRVRYANHWKPHLEMIDTVQAAINDGTPVAVRFDALGPSADVTKRPGPQYGATTREGVLVRWQATTGRKRENYKGGGELNVLLADMTTLRNRAINVLEAKHPTLDPSRGGPGYSLAAIMADAETYIANKGRNADPGTGLTPERLRVAKGLIEYGPDNVFGGLIDKDGIWRTPRLELIESVTPTGRRGHNMVGNNADGTMTQPPPKPMPDMGTDVAPAAPDAPAAAARDRIKRNLGSQSGALDVSILADIVDYGRGLYRAGMDAAVWTANMIKEFGQRIKPLLQEAFKRVVNAYQASRFSDTTGAVNVTGMNKPQAATAAPPFYMKSAQVLDSKIQGKAATADQVRAILKNPQNGIKAEELKWTGIEQAVERIAKENGGKVPKEALLRYLQEDGAVRLEEVVLPEDPKLTKEAQEDPYFDPAMYSDNVAKYGNYQLPGGENYREMVLTFEPAMQPAEAAAAAKNSRISAIRYKDLPQPVPRLAGDNMAMPNDWVIIQGEAPLMIWGDADSAAGAVYGYNRNLDPDLPALPSQTYTSSHFQGVPNYVAHMRLNERTDAAGKPGLFLEEIQSDRHQAGREKGYREDFNKDRLNELSRKGLREITKDEQAELKSLLEQRDALANGGIPDAPFRKDWPVQMFKRALADAVGSGKEWIGWTTGETQAARYDLSQHFDRIRVHKIESPADQAGWHVEASGNDSLRKVARTDQELADTIGKELADKAIKQITTQVEKDAKLTQKRRAAATADPYEADFTGVDLRVGGEGMKGFYDQILPKEISKYVKQWGGQVEKGTINPRQGKLYRMGDGMWQVERADGDISTFANRDGAELYLRRGSTPIWRVNITPQMREGIKKAGQALFVGGVAAVVAEEEL